MLPVVVHCTNGNSVIAMHIRISDMLISAPCYALCKKCVLLEACMKYLCEKYESMMKLNYI